jgi:hypothetical protein
MTSDEAGLPTLSDIDSSAKELRRVLRILRAGGKGEISVQNVSDYAMMHFHDCTFQGLQPPDELVLLFGEILDDPKRKKPRGHSKPSIPRETSGECHVCAPIHTTTPEEVRAELHQAHDALRPHLEAAICGVSVLALEAFDKAAQFEATSLVDANGQMTSTATVSSLARESTASRDSVRRWREMLSYRNRVALLWGRG